MFPLFIRHQLFRSRLFVITAFLFVSFLAYFFILYDDYTPAEPPSRAAAKKIPLAVVLPKTKKERVGWVKQLEPDWVPFVYSVDNDPRYTLRTPKNVGREAMVYLSFIIDYYDSLPDIVAFTHGTNRQWHNDIRGLKTTTVLSQLQTKAVKRQGYVNLRCIWEPGCPTSLNPFTPTEIDIREQNERAKMPEILMELLNITRKEVPNRIGGVCCAQFAVTRQRIQARSREDYIRMRNWALEYKATSFAVGWVFEMIWHMIFQEEAVYCPPEPQCRCDLYGVCTL